VRARVERDLYERMYGKVFVVALQQHMSRLHFNIEKKKQKSNDGKKLKGAKSDDKVSGLCSELYGYCLAFVHARSPFVPTCCRAFDLISAASSGNISV